MATGEDWSREEVESIVADYLSMLESELAGHAAPAPCQGRAVLTA